MKKLLILFVLILLVSCGHNYDDFKNIDVPGNVIAKRYDKPLLDSLQNRIISITELADDLKNARVDTISGNTIVLDSIIANVTLGRQSFNKGYNVHDFIFLNSSENIRRAGEAKEGKLGYSLTWLDTTFTSKPMEEGFYLWGFRNGGYRTHTKYDSIDRSRVEEIKKRLVLETSVIKKAKYLVAVRDVSFMEPKMVDNESFEPGILISEVKIYNLKTSEKLGNCVVMATNTDSVHNFINAISREMKQDLILGDLLSDKHHQIINFLKNKEDE